LPPSAEDEWSLVLFLVKQFLNYRDGHASILFLGLRPVGFFPPFAFRSTSFHDVRREFMQRLSAARHRILGSYLRDALQEGGADAVACLPVPRVFSSFLLFAWWPPLLFLLKKLLDPLPFLVINILIEDTGTLQIFLESSRSLRVFIQVPVLQRIEKQKMLIKTFLQEKALEATKQKEETRKKPRYPYQYPQFSNEVIA
jgi:hypothetical protein